MTLMLVERWNARVWRCILVRQRGGQGADAFDLRGGGGSGLTVGRRVATAGGGEGRDALLDAVAVEELRRPLPGFCLRVGRRACLSTVCADPARILTTLPHMLTVRSIALCLWS